MHKKLKGFSILNTVFNIRAGEWPRVFTAWMIRLLYRITFVVAWTVLIGIFIGRYGIYYLPYLFVINAVFTILGSIFYSTFFDRFKLEYIMIGTIFSACALFMLAHYVGPDREVLFFALLLVSIAVFLMQLMVILSSYVEELFSPLESERTFPFIESSETFGGIAAGLLITLLIGDVATSSFLYLLIGLLIMILPFVLLYKLFSSRSIFAHTGVKNHMGAFEAWSKFMANKISGSLKSYLFGILLIVILHYMLFNLLEFQYTKAVYQNASHVILEAGSGFEHAIVHDLGQLFILFSSLALIVQLLIGSRLINSLGIVGSMIVHPIVTILSIFGLLFSFSFSAAVLAKTNFTLTGVIFLNAYHSSYYAIPENLRNHARELLVGVVRPIGAIIGAGFLIILQQIFVNESFVIYSVNGVMMVTALIFLFVTYNQQKKYSDVALSLLKSSNKTERFHAIEIMAQRGHKCGVGILIKLVLNKHEKTSMRVKAVAALADRCDVSLTPSFIKFLSCDNYDVRKEALAGLASFNGLGNELSKTPVMERDLICTLRDMFKSEKSFDLRDGILSLFANINTLSAVDFLLYVLKNTSGKLKANAILALSEFDDPAVCQHVRPFLKSRSWDASACALIVLKKCKDPLLNFKSEFDRILDHKSDSAIMAAMLVVGELKLSDHRNLCIKFSHARSMDVKLSALLALIQLDDSRVIPMIVDVIFSSNFDVASKLKRMIASVNSIFSHYILSHINHLAIHKAQLLLGSHGALKSKKRLDKDVLHTLRKLYLLSDDYDEVDDISTLLLEFAQ